MSASQDEIQRQMEQNQGLVRTIAAGVRRRVPRHVGIDDLVAFGQIGLAEAARDFDPSRGFTFSTYAYHRIRGAIYDGVSKLNWTSPAHYNRIRYEQLAAAATDPETANERGDPKQTSLQGDMQWLNSASERLAVVYLTCHHGRCDEQKAEQIADPEAPSAMDVIANRELCEKLHQLIDELPEQAASLIRATYFDGLTLQEAAERIGISKSWASRIHAKALEQMARSFRRLGAME